MGIEALTVTNAGATIVPESADDWEDWVSATATRNYILEDPLLDWLDRYGEAHGFRRDTEYPDYDSRMDYTAFIAEQGERFGRAVIELIERRIKVETIALNAMESSRSLERARQTFEAMVRGVPIIHQGVLRDAEHRCYGVPDILIRSDALLEMFPNAISADEASQSAPDLGSGPWHYRVVDIKFRTLDLSANGELSNEGSAPAYKVQLFIYNRALGRLQGFEPPVAYLLGRGWKQTKKGTTQRGQSCMERLAPVPQIGTVANKRPILEAELEATAWVRRLRSDGSRWSVLPRPSVDALYPDLTNQQDGPWHRAKKDIAEQLEDLTLLWQVGVRGRREGHAAGVYHWRDPRVTPGLVGVSGTRAPILQSVLDINRSASGSPVQPAVIDASAAPWREIPALEFYVDFEWVNDLADDFSRMPEKAGQALIFLIGCGHVEGGEWRFRSFLADALTENAEGAIIDAWLTYMAEVRARVNPSNDHPPVIHWSPAEETSFETQYNSATQRHQRADWQGLRWFDFLAIVIRAQPVVVRGALGFGLKAVANAMHRHGLIETRWDDCPIDGLGAMLVAWWCADEARRSGATLGNIELMQAVLEYNAVDCKVMMEVVRYLRDNH